MVSSEIRICQNCKQNFVIEPEDFQFYEKIRVPAPTWCPECRLIRRLVWRNDRTLYKSNCDFCGKNMISIYPPESVLKVYCNDCWWSDKWDPVTYSIKLDFTKPFFEQYQELAKSVPVMNLFNTKALNSEYCNYAGNNKNCYLLIGGRESENIMYANRVFSLKDSVDLYDVNRVELCYQLVQYKNSTRLFFSQLCSDCSDSLFLYDCKNCQNCFGCIGLRGQQYNIFNKTYTKEEYFLRLKEFNLESYSGLELMRRLVNEHFARYIRRYAHIINSPDSTGDNLYNIRNCKFCFDITGTDSENCKFTHFVGVGIKDSYDNYGAPRAEQVYETLAIGLESNNNSRYYFSYFVKESHDVWYSYNCISSSHLFGCVGLRNKQYCILNKQYTKEEYESLIPKIIDHMNKMPYVDKKGRVYKYGEFFPPELSPFAYNETIAQEYFPLTKEQALAQGYRWKDPEERNIKPDYYTKDLADHIKDVKDDILGKIIQCAHSQIKEDGTLEANCNEQCTTAFKIIPQELEFYRRMNLPLPRLCPNCRHFQRLKQRNPLKLWHRKCQCQGTYGQNPNNSNIYQNQTTHFHQNKPCSNEFYTSYAPDRPEIVYCDKCYQAEVV